MGIINGYIEIFAAAIILVSLVGIEPKKTADIVEKRLTAMIFCHVLALVLDAGRWFLHQSPEWGLLQTVLSVAPTIFALVGHASFVLFAIEFLSQRGTVPPKINIVFLSLFVLTILVWAMFILANGIQSAANMQTNYAFMRHNLSYWLGHLSWGATCIVGIWLIFRCKKGLSSSELFSFLSYCVFPLIALFLRFFWDGAQIFLSTSLSLMWISVVAYRGQRQSLHKKETQLAHNRVAMVLSRIKPELFDKILGIICELCDEDAYEAKKLTLQFAAFLRYNLEAVNQDKPVPFTEELAHTQGYLNLEKTCLNDKLECSYNIEDKDFYIPSLTVQPLVENAVAQGIVAWENGCKVSIYSKELCDAHQIEIVIQGLYDTAMVETFVDKLLENSKNVSERLHLICKGSLNICSRDDGSPAAVITIPKQAAGLRRLRV